MDRMNSMLLADYFFNKKSKTFFPQKKLRNFVRPKNKITATCLVHSQVSRQLAN